MTDNKKDTSLLRYNIYYGRKKFYDTGPLCRSIKCCCAECYSPCVILLCVILIYFALLNVVLQNVVLLTGTLLNVMLSI
jgi:hypothetical protein